MNILIIKIGALGDVVRTSFIAQALKDKYIERNVKITWVTSELGGNFFKNNKYVDRVVEESERRNLVNEKFDMVINLEEDTESCEVASKIDSRYKIGFLLEKGKVVPTKSTKEWFDMSALGKKPENDKLKKANKKSHRQILGEIIGVDWKKYEPHLRIDLKQRKIAEDFMRVHNLERNDFIVGFNTGSADRWPKALPVDKTIKLMEKVYKETGAKILIFGGPKEIERNREIIKKVKCPVIDTGCGNNLLEFPALISICKVFVSTDSLGLHISLGLKRKTVSLIGPTSANEIDMYGIGEKIITKSKDLCSYKTKSNAMDKIDIKEVAKAVKNLKEDKVSFVITGFKEPNIGKAIVAAMNQENCGDYEIIVSAPDEDTLKIAREYAKKDKRIKIFKDPGKGKSFALNKLFKEIDCDIIVLTDGDVHVSKNSLKEILETFKDPIVGAVTGRPVPFEDKREKYGYWANFLFEAAHDIRKRAFKRRGFIECSGYLFGFRKKKIEKIPLDVAEDTYIPYIFWGLGYEIGYAEKAEVYVKNARDWKDWITQKTRTSKAHETLEKYVNTKQIPRVKNFSNESKGIKLLFSYPSGPKEFFWTVQLIFARGYMWMKVFKDTKVSEKHYQDGWERIESTK